MRKEEEKAQGREGVSSAPRPKTIRAFKLKPLGRKPKKRKRGKCKPEPVCDENVKAANSALGSDRQGSETGKLNLGTCSWDLKATKFNIAGP